MRNNTNVFCAITFFILFLFILASVSFAESFSKKSLPWNLFRLNSSILGLKLGESTFNDAIKKMGGESPENPSGKHEALKICYRHNEIPQYISFKTGSLNDYSTLYSFGLSKTHKNESLNKCRKYLSSENGVFNTDGGLHLDQSKNDVISILGNPSETNGPTMYWRFKNYKKYAEPKISFTEAGPTNARYNMKFISNGLYESGTVSIEFLDDKTVDINVEYYAESDFKIEHYDITTGKRIR